jgi:hypothetical protein
MIPRGSRGSRLEGGVQYANVLELAEADGEAWLRFGLRRPGGRLSVTVTEHVVPSAILEQIRGKAPRRK